MDALSQRAAELAGYRLGELAEQFAVPVPENLNGNKGWVGQLIEVALGADAGNRSVPDFESLGVELKTLPTDARGKPKESTYVTTVRFADVEDATWEDSFVRSKLGCVLWVPILSERHLRLEERVVGRSVLWKPSEADLALLRRDWEEHMRVIRDGYVDTIRGRDGAVLQIRPKAPNARAKTWTVDERGEAIMTNPRGFYLRPAFTHRILTEGLIT